LINIFKLWPPKNNSSTRDFHIKFAHRLPSRRRAIIVIIYTNC
jgi:hypothetical protein